MRMSDDDGDRLSAVDRSNLRAAAAGAPMHVGVLALLEAAPLLTADGEVRLDALHRRLTERAPRGLRQVPVQREGLPRRWHTVPFDPVHHLRTSALPHGADERTLLDTAAGQVMEPFPPDRPPWELVVLTGAADGRIGVLVRLHHVLADGIAAADLFAPLFDEDDVPVGDRGAPSPVDRRTFRLPGPLPVLRIRLRELVTVLAAALRPSPSFDRPVGTRRRLAATRAPFAPLRATAHAVDGRIDDLLLDAAAAGARALLEARGELRRTPRMVVSVAATLRRAGRPEQARNLAGVLPIPIPVGEQDPERRLAAIVRADRRVRGAPATQPSGRLLQRWMVRTMFRQRLVHLLLSNVPGPSRPLHLLGAAVEELIPIGLLQGNIPISVVGLSYAGAYVATVLADPEVVPDVELFVEAFTRRIDTLAH